MPNSSRLFSIVLAAGKGTRMAFDGPKVLFPICGRPLIDYVLDTTEQLGSAQTVVVVGHQADAVRTALQGRNVRFALQAEQLGTGHAVEQAAPLLAHLSGEVLVLCGDVPLVSARTLRSLLDTHRQHGAPATVLSAVVENPGAYGRMVTDAQGRLLRIVEKQDASAQELEINEINAGIYCFTLPEPFHSLPAIRPDNRKGEFYLTDIVAVLGKAGKQVRIQRCSNPQEVMGVNCVDDALRAEGFCAGQRP